MKYWLSWQRFVNNKHHEQIFGHLKDAEFTAQEAAEYLEVSMSIFRRMVASHKLTPSTTVGRNQLFAVADLKSIKRTLA